MAQEALKSPEYAGKGIELDGEMQADAALDAVVAKKKASDSHVAGQARVLISPIWMPEISAINCYSESAAVRLTVRCCKV